MLRLKFIFQLIILLTIHTYSVLGQSHGSTLESENNVEEFEHHCNFEHRSLTLGIGAPYAFNVETIGANFRMYYNFNENICLGPEYGYFRSEDYEIIDFDFVIHYIFETKFVGVYPLFGGNYTIEKEKHGAEHVEDAFGIVFGGGIHRNFGKISLFAEYSRIEVGIQDQLLSFGVMYTFD